MLRDSFGHARLMRESTSCVETALRSDHPHEQRVASRILDEPRMWLSWETHHAVLMRHVAEHRRLSEQLGALKQATFGLIHRKALFEYLRDKAVRGTMRARILAHFHPARSYTDAVLAEHGVYLRSACSCLCSNHIGGEIAHDPGFCDPMRRYEELYAEYLEAYCNAYFAPADAASAAQEALLPLLKHQLDECRRAILHPQTELPRTRRDAMIRRPLGDTQRTDARGVWARLAGQTVRQARPAASVQVT